jgi:mono/diheme cytochrome c family protein
MRKPGWLMLGALALFGLTVMAAEKPPESYVTSMRTIQATTKSLGGNATAKNYEGVAKDAAALKAAFTVIEQYWTAKKVDDAITLTKTAVKGATDLEAAATGKNDEGIAAAQRAIGGTCMGCHMAHRERLADGSFEIK